jgi:hypothetical protein
LTLAGERRKRRVGLHDLQVAVLDFAVATNRNDEGLFNRAAAWASRRNRC